MNQKSGRPIPQHKLDAKCNPEQTLTLSYFGKALLNQQCMQDLNFASGVELDLRAMLPK